MFFAIFTKIPAKHHSNSAIHTKVVVVGIGKLENRESYIE